MARRPLPDIAYVRDALDYDPDTGVFRWRVRPITHFPDVRVWRMWNTRFAGTIAGNTDPEGYRRILIKWSSYKAHRLAWLLVYGEDALLDHINGDPGDNRITNLRKTTPEQNMANTGVSRRSKTRVKGVRQDHGWFRAYIQVNKRNRHLGMFATLEEAAATRREAEQRLQGEFARKETSS